MTPRSYHAEPELQLEIRKISRIIMVRRECYFKLLIYGYLGLTFKTILFNIKHNNFRLWEWRIGTDLPDIAMNDCHAGLSTSVIVCRFRQSFLQFRSCWLYEP